VPPEPTLLVLSLVLDPSSSVCHSDSSELVLLLLLLKFVLLLLFESVFVRLLSTFQRGLSSLLSQFCPEFVLLLEELQVDGSSPNNSGVLFER
jgi:hypothetical protein